MVALDFCRSLYTAEKSCSGYKSLFVSFRLALFFGNFKLCSIVSCEGSESARDLADLFLPWECERWASGGSKFPLVSLLIFLLPTAICCCFLVLLLCRNPFATPLLVLILVVCCLIEDAVCNSLSHVSRKAMLLLSLCASTQYWSYISREIGTPLELRYTVSNMNTPQSHVFSCFGASLLLSTARQCRLHDSKVGLLLCGRSLVNSSYRYCIISSKYCLLPGLQYP